MDDPVLMAIAQTRERVASTAATPEQVDLVVKLNTLVRVITAHNQRVMVGDLVAWNELADYLTTAADQCRRQIVIEMSDPGGR